MKPRPINTSLVTDAAGNIYLEDTATGTRIFAWFKGTGPEWLPDGSNRFVYVWTEAPQGRSIAIATLDPWAVQVIGLALSSARAQLVMSDEGLNLLTVFPDTGETRTLPRKGATPSWTPDGRIIYGGIGDSHVHICQPDGSGDVTVSPRMAGQVQKPMMDAAGKIILFAVATAAGTDTWTINSDGSGLRLVASNAAAPFLAPSGTWFTYTYPDANRQIWRRNIDGSLPQQLTFPTADHPNGNASAISPDESQIAIYWGPEATNFDPSNPPNPFDFSHHDVAVMPVSGVTPPRVILASTPAHSVQDIPPGGALAYDDPTWNPTGLRVICDWGTPRPGEGGTVSVAVDNPADRVLLSSSARGGGNVPLRMVP